RCDVVQPYFHQYRHEYSSYARDGRATAALKLWRIFSDMLVDRRRHIAKCLHLPEVLLMLPLLLTHNPDLAPALALDLSPISPRERVRVRGLSHSSIYPFIHQSIPCL